MSNNDDKRPKKMDPLAITESLGFKTFRKSNRNTWLPEEDAQLNAILADTYANPAEGLKSINADEVDWDMIASKLYKDGSRKSKELKKRWTTSLDPNLRKGKWTKAEDEQLIQAYNRYGPSWQKVAASIRTRTMDQCAKRYTEVLDPKTKDRLIPWTREEELLLIKQVRIHGTKWRTVASNFKGRPSLTCRNRWRKIVINVVRGKADPVIQREVESITNKGVNLPKDCSPESSTSNLSNHSSPNFDDYERRLAPVNNIRTEVPSSRSEVEWKYTLAAPDGVDESKLPHSRLFDSNGGSIKDESLVQLLVQYAKMNSLNITVHQHVHHHYSPPPPPFAAAQLQKFPSPGLFPYASNSPQGMFGSTPGGNAPIFEGSPPNSQYPKSTGSYYLEPEATLNRFQHFNYLPPLTEVPKLTSSNSPPHSVSSKDKGGDYRENGKTEFNRILDDDVKREASPMTPLTQAVQIAAAAEANYNKRSHQTSGNDPVSKKAKFNSNSTVRSLSDDEEEGMDFWEQMRNLSDLPTNSQQQQIIAQKPVSQHHPLHYFMGSATPQPNPQPSGDQEDQMEEDEEEMDDEFRGYGVFYKSYPKDEPNDFYGAESSNGNAARHEETASAPGDSNDSENNSRVYENLISSFGVIPFNPS